jgi:hypothetical protein
MAFVPVKSHDDVLAVEDLPGVEVAKVAIERPGFPAVQLRRTTVGPVKGPQASVRIEQPEGKAFIWLAVELGGEEVVAAKEPGASDLPSAEQEIKVALR